MYYPCLMDENLSRTMAVLKPLVKIYIPYFIMVGLNIKVILRLRDSKKALQGPGVRNNTSKFAVSTILIDLIFLIFKSPEALLQIYSYIKQRQPTLQDLNQVNPVILIVNISTDVALTYSAVLVFIFLVFNRLFRQEVLRLGKISMNLSNRSNS